MRCQWFHFILLMFITIQTCFFIYMTHIFSSFAFLSPFSFLGMSHFGTEAGNVVVALLCVPFLSTLLASKTKLLVLVFSLGTRAVKTNSKTLATCENNKW